MWKKEDIPATPAAPQSSPTPSRPERSTNGELATIGRSITIRGEVSGDEDLLIQGRVEGSVDLRQHSLTIGPEGEVKATLVGRVVTIQGRVEGNVTAEEQVILRSSASVDGDITAPRVVLEDGARFRGGVDMGDAAERGRRSATSSSSARKEVLSAAALDAQAAKAIEARPAATA